MGYEEVDFETLQQLVEQERWVQFREVIGRIDPADLADFIEDLPSERRDTVFRMLDLETASDVLVELQSSYVDDVVEDLPSEHIADLAEQMAPDEAADFIGDLEEGQSAEVLAAMEPEERREVKELLQYDEDSAGSIMTPEMVSLPASVTVAETKEALAAADLADPVFNVYVSDPVTGALTGLISVAELLAAAPGATLQDVADREYVYATAGEDQQEVARKFRKYDLWVMPVVDAAHRLIGRITADDVIDVLHEEADEDLAHLVGAPDIDEEEDSIYHITRMRLPWLLITMFAGLLNSVIIKTIIKSTEVAMVAIFVPVVLAMGGNTGMQSSAICIRGMALGERKYGKLLLIAWREIRVGSCLGLICGSLSALVLSLTLMLTGGAGGVDAQTMRLALVVGLAMCNAMAFASSFGAVVPVILHRFGVDPAVASGPFITTSNDLSASAIYFLTCLLLLGPG